MARRASTTSATPTAETVEVDAVHSYTVNSPSGVLNVRQNPTVSAKILARLHNGEKVKIDTSAEVPEGWKAVIGGGYVLSMYLE